MDKLTDVEKNKILVEFLGWKINSDNTVEIPLSHSTYFQGEVVSIEDISFYNWDLIMYIVSIIEKSDICEYFQIIYSRYSQHLVHIGTKYGRVVTRDNSKLKAVYLACVEFAIWSYNLNKK